MRLTAAILCIYLVGLLLQPTLFTLHAHPAMSCCSNQSGATAKHSCCTDTDKDKSCGDFGQCNPFFSQCPLCAAVCLPTPKFEFTPTPPFEGMTRQKFYSRDNHLVSDFHEDLLRPPAFVC